VGAVKNSRSVAVLDPGMIPAHEFPLESGGDLSDGVNEHGI